MSEAKQYDSTDLLGPLPEPDYPAGVSGMLGQHCFTAEQMRAYAARCMAAERERCAKPMEDAAAKLIAPKRTNEVDRHVADILQRHAARIRGA